jgi:hypothetical protein
MSVELLDNDRFYGLRVRRQIDGKTYQEYFSLKADGKRMVGKARAEVKAQAEARDAELSAIQEKSRDSTAKSLQLDQNGRVKGILFRLKREKSGTWTPVFQIGLMSRVRNKVVNTTVSVNRFGLEDAWVRAVDFYCEHKGIDRRAKTYRELIAHQPSKRELNALLRSAG